jgi:hypothetical protein
MMNLRRSATLFVTFLLGSMSLLLCLQGVRHQVNGTAQSQRRKNTPQQKRSMNVDQNISTVTINKNRGTMKAKMADGTTRKIHHPELQNTSSKSESNLKLADRTTPTTLLLGENTAPKETVQQHPPSSVSQTSSTPSSLSFPTTSEAGVKKGDNSSAPQKKPVRIIHVLTTGNVRLSSANSNLLDEGPKSSTNSGRDDGADSWETCNNGLLLQRVMSQWATVRMTMRRTLKYWTVKSVKAVVRYRWMNAPCLRN